MLVLVDHPDGFPDDDDPHRRYRLPTGLVPAPHPDRPPDVALVTGPDGGVLTLRLMAAWPTLGVHEHRAPLAGGRVRVVTRGLGTDGAGAWGPAHVGGELLVDRRLSLTAADAQVLRMAVEAGAAAIDVEVELEVRGRTPSLPWVVRAPGPLLADMLRAVTGAAAVPWSRMVDAFAALGTDALTWHAREPGAIRAPVDGTLALVLASAARDQLISRTQEGWIVREDPPAQVDLSLGVPTLAVRTVRLGWSFSTFLAGVDDPLVHVTDVSRTQPLRATDLHVVNEVPLAPDGIRRIDVDVETGGPSGSMTCHFAPGEPDAARLRFVQIAGRDEGAAGGLSWRTRTTVDVDGRPVVLQGDPRKTGLLLRILPADLGLAPVRVAVEGSVLETLATIRVTVGTRTLVLNAERPVAWVVGRTSPAMAMVAIDAADGTSLELGEVPVVDGDVAVTAATLGMGTPATVSLAPADWEAVAYLAVQIEGAGWRSVEPGTALSWQVRRRHRGAAPTVVYRTRHVPRVAGSTQPMIASQWHEGIGPNVSVLT